jgi:hypothetical protein
VNHLILTILIPIPHPSPYLFLSLLSHISFFHLISLPFSFGISPRFFPSLCLISLHPFLDCLSLSLSSRHILHLFSSPSIQYLFSVSSFPHLNFAIIFLSFALSLPGYSLLYLVSLILCLLSCFVSLSLSVSSTFSYLSFTLNLSTSLVVFLSLLLLRVLFLFSPAFR